MGLQQALIKIYKEKYKQLFFITVIILVLSFGILAHSKLTTGEFVQKGVSLKGGITITIPSPKNIVVADVQAHLDKALPTADINVRGITEAGRTTNILVEAADAKEEDIIQALHTVGFDTTEFSVESMGASLGERFFRQTFTAIVIAFILMGIVVYVTFRVPLPSFFVVLAAASDIITTLAVISFLDIRLSTAGIAAFLMLIGYSVDTDIMLTTRVLKRKEGELFDRILSAFRTGMIMTGTSLAATLIAFIFTQSDVIKQIMLILTIGLFFDMLYTWIQNAGILRYYLEKKKKQHHE